MNERSRSGYGRMWYNGRRREQRNVRKENWKVEYVINENQGGELIG